MVKLQANIKLAEYDAMNPRVREFLESRNLTKVSEVNSLREKDIELG